MNKNILIKVIYALGIIIVAIIIFQAGIIVGFHKASFTRNWDRNYIENFGQKSRSHFPGGHGANGTIIGINEKSITLLDHDGTEKIILLNADTNIRKMRETGNLSDLSINTFVVVIGEPNPQGQIEAKFIRILPNPPKN